MAVTPKNQATKKAATRKGPDSGSGVPLLEWVMAGLGLLLVIGALTAILQGARGADDPPELTARLTQARPAADGWVADVEVLNTGGKTAAQVQIEGVLDAETAMATIDYVPSEGRETVGLGFASDPRAGLELRVRGWVEP